MAKKALCVGCNYSGKLKLNGCVNDCEDQASLAVQSLGVPQSEVTVLADGPVSGFSVQQPTKQNILNAMRRFTRGAQAGDMLYFTFSGHGTQVPDRTGEERDGMDEAIVPGDYGQTGRVITDDELYAYLVQPLPEGVLLTCVFDCCHAGTILDLDDCIDSTSMGRMKAGKQRYLADTRVIDLSEYDGEVINRAIPPIMDYIADEIPEPEAMERGGAGPGVFCFSGCRDDQTSLDVRMNGRACGVLTNSLMKALKSGGLQSDYETLFRTVIANKNDMQSQFKVTQCPQLSYNESASPDSVTFCSPPRGGAGFIGAVPAMAAFFTGKPPRKDKKEKDKKEKKGGKEGKDKKGKKDKEKKGGKEKKDKGKKEKKGKSKDLLGSDSDDSDSDSDDDLSKKANIGKQVLGAALNAFR